MNNVYHLNREMDIFLFNDNEIAIVSEDTIIDIKDNNNSEVCKLFVELSRNGANGVLSKQQLNNLNLHEVIKQLIELGVFIEEKEKSSFPDKKYNSIKPYIAQHIAENVWCIRRGLKLFYFKSNSETTAFETAHTIMCAWLDEIERGIIANVAKKSITCIPAYHEMLTSYEWSQISPNDVLIFNSKTKEIVVKKFIYNYTSLNFWEELMHRSSNEIGIAPVLLKQKYKLSKKLGIEQKIYFSCHKVHAFDDLLDDEWQVGSDKSDLQAKGKAVMESIERYCGRQHFLSEEVYATYKDLKNIIHPNKLVKYSPNQNTPITLERFDENKHYRWIKATQHQIVGGGKYIPIDFVLFPSCAEFASNRLFLSTSNGMSAHVNFAQGVQNASFEIIERDSIMIHWLNRISPIRITFDDAMPIQAHNFKRNINGIGLEFEVLRLTLDTVPVVLSVVHGLYEDIPLFLCGAASASNYEDAILKSLDEVSFISLARLSNIEELRQRINTLNVKNVYSPLDHEALYMKNDMKHHICFLLNGNEFVSIFDIKHEEVCLDSVLKKHNQDRYIIDMTHNYVKHLGLGISVCRVIMPGFIPITFGYGYEPLGMQRILDIPKKLGLIKPQKSEIDLVDEYLPHFFA